jgi:hypothetical protein
MLRARMGLLLKPYRGEMKIKDFDGANPNATFDKYVEIFEQNQPFKEKDGRGTPEVFGEMHHSTEKRAIQMDARGEIQERESVRLAKAMFKGADPNHRATRAAFNPAARKTVLQERKWDKTVIKTSKEDPEYYYRKETLSEKRQRRLVVAASLSIGVFATGWGMIKISNTFFPI